MLRTTGHCAGRLRFVLLAQRPPRCGNHTYDPRSRRKPGGRVKHIILICLTAAATLVTPSALAQIPPLQIPPISPVPNSPTTGNMTCGLPPLPQMGCRVGACVDGQWQQICDQAPTKSCGLPPLPDPGCQIGECVDGRWQEVCNQSPAMSCGLPPLPALGCRIGACVDGRWQQVCQ